MWDLPGCRYYMAESGLVVKHAIEHESKGKPALWSDQKSSAPTK